MPAAVSRMRIAGPAFSSSGAALPPRARARSAVPRWRSIRQRGGRRASRLCRGPGARLPPPPFALRADPGIDKGLDTSGISADGRRPLRPVVNGDGPLPAPVPVGPAGGCAYRAPRPRPRRAPAWAPWARIVRDLNAHGGAAVGAAVACAQGNKFVHQACKPPCAPPPSRRRRRRRLDPCRICQAARRRPRNFQAGTRPAGPRHARADCPRRPAPCPRRLPPPARARRGPITCGTGGTPTPGTAARAHRSRLSARLRVAWGGSHWAS